MKTFKSRYAVKIVNSNLYGTVTVSGNTFYPTATSGNTVSAGYIFAPYIMMNTSSTLSSLDMRKLQIEQLREERIQKLNKIYEINN